MNLTNERRVLLEAAAANRQVCLITTAGSANDDLWRALVDRGMLEQMDKVPDAGVMALVQNCGMRAYRVTARAVKTDDVARAASWRAIDQYLQAERLNNDLN